VSSSGLIYAAIALVWAAVLIPMWLRNHESAGQNRSAERFGQAMSVLSRKTGSEPELAYANAEQEPVIEAPQLPVARRTSTPTRQSHRAVSAPRPRPRPEQSGRRTSLARRRARTLAVLAGATILLGLLSVAGLVPVWALVPMVVLLVGFVVNLRVQAKRTAAIRQRRRRPPADRSAEQRDVAARQEPAARERSRRESSRAVVVETKRRGAGESVEASPAPEDVEPVTAGSDDEEWRPNALPVPTYVTAPKAI
jgi:Flp pilus assembly protein TadB